MITFLFKNHFKLFLFVSFFSIVGVFVSHNLITEISSYYQLKEKIELKPYDGILYQEEQIMKYNYKYDELIEVFNFSTNNNKDFNSVLIMQNEDYSDENDLVCPSFESYNCNLKPFEVAVSKSLSKKFNLNINDEIRLNSLNEKTFVIKAFINDEAIFYVDNSILNLPLIILAYDASLNWNGNLDFYLYQDIADLEIDNKLELSTVSLVSQRLILSNFTLYFSIFVVFSIINLVIIDSVLNLKIIRLKYSELGYKSVYKKFLLLLFIVIFFPWIITQITFFIVLENNTIDLVLNLFSVMFGLIILGIELVRRLVL